MLDYSTLRTQEGREMLVLRATAGILSDTAQVLVGDGTVSKV